LRILAVSLYVLYNGTENADKFHDNVGIAVYIISFAIIFYTANMIQEKGENPEIQEGEKNEAD